MSGRSRGTIINHTKTRKSGRDVVYVDNPNKINSKRWMWQYFLPALEEQETLRDMTDMMNTLRQVDGFTADGFENPGVIRPDKSNTNKSPAGGRRPFPGGILTNYAIKQTIITKKAEEDKEKKAMAAAIKQWEPDMFQSVPSVVGGGGGAARPTPAGAGGGGGGGSHPSSTASYYRNRPSVHGDRGLGWGRHAVDVVDTIGGAVGNLFQKAMGRGGGGKKAAGAEAIQAATAIDNGIQAARAAAQEEEAALGQGGLINKIMNTTGGPEAKRQTAMTALLNYQKAIYELTVGVGSSVRMPPARKQGIRGRVKGYERRVGEIKAAIKHKGGQKIT